MARKPVSVACPHCGNRQPESILAISTFCRSCGHHFEIGETSQALSRLASSDALTETPPARPGILRNFLAESSLRSRVDSITRNLRVIRVHLADLASKFRRFVPGFRGIRSVHCFDCGTTHGVPAAAMSTSCPKCGSPISLADIDVSELQTLEARTQGDVVVRKDVTLVGGATCRNLTIHGKVLGRIRCTGTATFRNSGHILGRVRCRKIVVARGISLTFSSNVSAEEMHLLGSVTGDFSCHGTLRIGKKGEVHGIVATLALIIEPGGSLDGDLRALPPATSAGENALPSRPKILSVADDPESIREETPALADNEAPVAR